MVTGSIPDCKPLARILIITGIIIMIAFAVVVFIL